MRSRGGSNEERSLTETDSWVKCWEILTHLQTEEPTRENYCGHRRVRWRGHMYRRLAPKVFSLDADGLVALLDEHPSVEQRGRLEQAARAAQWPRSRSRAERRVTNSATHSRRKQFVRRHAGRRGPAPVSLRGHTHAGRHRTSADLPAALAFEELPDRDQQADGILLPQRDLDADMPLDSRAVRLWHPRPPPPWSATTRRAHFAERCGRRRALRGSAHRYTPGRDRRCRSDRPGGGRRGPRPGPGDHPRSVALSRGAGQVLASLHHDHGTGLRMRRGVTALKGTGATASPGSVCQTAAEFPPTSSWASESNRRPTGWPVRGSTSTTVCCVREISRHSTRPESSRQAMSHGRTTPGTGIPFASSTARSPVPGGRRCPHAR